MLYTKFKGHRPLGSDEESLYLLLYMGMVMCPGTFEIIFIPIISWGLHMKFGFNRSAVSEEKKFENVESE